MKKPEYPLHITGGKEKNILPVYKYGERVIWGVTARIVRGFVKKMT